MKAINKQTGEYVVHPLYPLSPTHSLFIYKDKPIALFPPEWVSADVPDVARFKAIPYEWFQHWKVRFLVEQVYAIQEYLTRLHIPYFVYMDISRKVSRIAQWHGNPVREVDSPFTHYIGPFQSKGEADALSEFYTFYGRLRSPNEDLSATILTSKQ